MSRLLLMNKNSNCKELICQFVIGDIHPESHCASIPRCSIVLHVFTVLGVSEKLILKPDPSLYHHINQGCLKVEGMDEKAQMQEVDVGSMCTYRSRFSIEFQYVNTTNQTFSYSCTQLMIINLQNIYIHYYHLSISMFLLSMWLLCWSKNS